MKKLMTVLLGILLAANVTNAALTSNGEIAANIALTTAITVAAYPTNTATGAPALVIAGNALNVDVVTGIVIDDNSIAGWTLDVVPTTGVLTNATNGATMAYDLTMVNIGGTLGTALTLNASSPLALGAAAITATGTATAATVAYSFDLNMDVANTETANKLSGDYVDTITLTIASND
ncbi:MAG: hypothetical protein GQ534_09830 [Candidatus Delongbacteria bacterium]|nr:hypothetical protein [Candidatus Delongbacteria bacterium]